MPKINLSKEHGVNPTICQCERCGKETGAIVLAGKCNKYECQECGAEMFGQKKPAKCSGCGGYLVISTDQDVAAPRYIRQGLCPDCEEEIAKQENLVRLGGIFWRCSECGSSGVIRPGTDMALMVRHKLGILTPAPCGIELTSGNCPICQGRK